MIERTDARHKGVMPIPELIRQSAQEYGPQPCLIARDTQPDRMITYSELLERVQGLAKGLASLGVSFQDKCAILGPNSPEWAMAYLAISSCGAICIPLDSMLTENELRHLLSNAQVKVAFVAPKFLDCVCNTHKDFPGPKHVVLLSANPERMPPGVLSMQALAEKGKAYKRQLPEPGLEDIAAILYTSGTTGRPKGVMLTHCNIVSDVAACYSAVQIGQERFLSVLPMHHTFECTAGFLLPLYSGSSITFARSLKSNQILEDLRASRATVMLGVPLLFQKMLDGIYKAIERKPFVQRQAFKTVMKAVKAAERLGRENLGGKLFKSLREKAGLGHLRLMVVGGAPLMPHVPVEFRRLGFTMLQGYGLTEASPVLTFNRGRNAVPESIGRPLPGVKVRILEPDANGVGELVFSGPMVMKGYYNNPEATAEVLMRDENGGIWLRTGDLGLQDKNGLLYVSGRAKNLIVTAAGKNVYPEEIEAELNMSPFILESMVYGQRTEQNEEEVRAVVVPNYEEIGRHLAVSKMTEQAVQELISREVRKVNQKLAGYKKIKGFILVEEELPKTSTRKIKRHLFKIPQNVAVNR